MAPVVYYPYDPTGTMEECLIKGEVHSLSSIDNTFRVIVPELHPFFHNSKFKLIHNESRLELKLGRDYELGERYVDVSGIADEPVYAFITIINARLRGALTLDYQTLGSDYAGVKNEVVDYLVNHLIDPLTTTFDKTLNRPVSFAPAKHEQHFADFQNKQYIASSIDGVATAAANRSNALKAANVDYLTNRIQQLDSIIETSGFKAHILSVADPHDVTAAQADALPLNGQAVDAFKAYAKTMAELATYINSAGITQADLDEYLAKYDDDVFSGRLKIVGANVRVQNDTGNAYIDMNNGNLTMVCQRAANLVADDQRAGGAVAKLQAGKNVLTIDSNGGSLGTSSLKFNNKVVLSAKNVKSYLDQVDFGTVTVTVTDSASVDLSGNGTQANKLQLAVKYTAATDVQAGAVQLSDATDSDSTTLAASAKAVATVMAALSGYVPASRKINGQPLSGNVNITAADVSLGSVNNTRDTAKPISTDQATLLSRYSPTVHTHEPSSVIFNRPTETEYGIAKLATAVASAAPTDVATPAIFGEVNTQVDAALALLNGRLDKDTVTLSHYGGTALASVSGTWVLNISEGGTYYSNNTEYSVQAASFNVSLQYPALYKNMTFYLYVKVEAGVASYFLSQELIESSDIRLHVGTLKTSLTGISSVEIRPTISFGPIRSLTDHIKDPAAHGYGAFTPATIGLDKLKNYPMAHYANPFSPLAVVDGWNDFPDMSVGTKSAWSITPYANAFVANFLGKTGPIGGKYYPGNLWDFIIPQANSGGRYVTAGVTAATAQIDMQVTFPSTITNTAEAYEATEVVLGVYNNKRLSLVVMGTGIVGEITAKLYWGWKTTDEVLISTLGGAVANITAISTSVRRWCCQLTYLVDADGTRRIDYLVMPAMFDTDYATPHFVSLAGSITEASLTVLNHSRAFASGQIGVFLRGAYRFQGIFNQISIPKSYRAYASANMVSELQKRLGGVKVIWGTVTSTAYIPSIPGCRKAIIMIQPTGFSAIAAHPNAALQQYSSGYNYMGNYSDRAFDQGREMTYRWTASLTRYDSTPFTQVDGVGVADTAVQYMIIGFTDDVWFET